MHTYGDKYSVRTLETEKLAPNFVLLQDIPRSVLNKLGVLGPTKIQLVTCNLKATTKRINANKCPTITVVLSIKNILLGLKFVNNEVVDF